MNLDTLRIPFFRPGLWSNKISTEQYKKGVDKERTGWYDKIPPRKSGGDEIKKSQKKIKKGDSITKIADDLVEDEIVISPIYKMVKEYPEDTEKDIYQRLN